MRWFWQPKTENRMASYQDTLVEAILSAAQGNLSASAAQSAAVEFAAGLWERCFAVAGVTPESLSRTLTPFIMGTMARRLALTGNAVFAVDTSRGQLDLLPAANYTISGGVRESSWRYQLELPGPSRTEVRRLPSTSVVHIKMGAPVEQPWNGCSPLTNAGVSATLLGRTERRMAQEMNARTGHLLTMPDGTSDETITGLRTDMAALQGGVALVETTSGGHGQGVRGAPQVDWSLKRFGATVPESNVALRAQVMDNIVAAMGIMPALYSGSDGATVREAYRQLLVATLQPLSALASHELERKIERTVTFDFQRLQAADIASRARAFGSLVAAGVDEEEAKTISGLTA